MKGRENESGKKMNVRKKAILNICRFASTGSFGMGIRYLR